MCVKLCLIDTDTDLKNRYRPSCITIMSYHHFTRCKARTPSVSDSDEGDVEPDDVTHGAAAHPVSEPPPCTHL